MNNRIRTGTVLSLTIGALSLAGYAGRADAALSDDIAAANCGLTPTNNCITYGDFNVFSMPLLQLRENGSSVPGPGDVYYYPSTYGSIKENTIIGINNGNYTDTGNPPGSIDGSYDTPSNNSGSTFTTQTSNPGGVADPNGDGEFNGDSEDSWDARTTTLLNLIGNTPLVAYFAFNETGSGTGLLTTDLLVWAQVTLGSDTSASTATFHLGGMDEPSTAANLLPAPDGSDSNGDDPGAVTGFGSWVYVHAGICADAAGNFLGFPDLTGTCALGAVRNQNNLGQNAAAFAINSPDLDAALKSGQYNYMQVLWKMAYVNGGGETAWIQSITAPIILVPEPAALTLVSIGLLGFAVAGGGVARRRRRQQGAAGRS